MPSAFPPFRGHTFHTTSLGVGGLLLAAACVTTSQPPGETPVVPQRPTPPLVPVPTRHLRFEPAGGRFLLHRRDSTITATPAGEQSQAEGRGLYLSVTPLGRTGSAGGALYEARLDSLVPDPGTLLDSAAAFSLKGAAWEVERLANGRAVALRRNRDDRLLTQFDRSIWLLFPLLPAGEMDPAQSTWPDSTDRAITTGAFSGREIGQSAYRMEATPDSLSAGGPVTIHVESVYTWTGAGATGDRALEMSAIGIRMLNYFYTYDGVVQAGAGSDTTSMTIRIPESGATVAARQIGTITLRRLGPTR